MRSLIQHLARSTQRKPGTTLVVGAGGCTELPQLRQLGSPRLILVEAHPQQAQELSQRIDPARGEEVWSSAITALPSDQIALHVVNNLRYNSVRSPEGLSEHFPSLRETRTISVPARSLSEVVEGLGLDVDGDHLLVLDAPGLALELAQSTPTQLLQAFTWIIVCGGIEPLYLNEKAGGGALTALEVAGFDVEQDDPDVTYPHTAVLLRRNDAAVNTLRLNALLEKTIAERATLQTQLATLTQERDAAGVRAAEQHADQEEAIGLLMRERDTLVKCLAEGQTQLQECTRAQAEQHKLAAEQELLVQQLTQRRDNLTVQLAEHQAQMEEISQALAGMTVLAADRAELLAEQKLQLQECTRAQVEQHGLAAERELLVQQLTQRRDSLTKQLTEYQAQVGEITEALAEQRALATERGDRISQLERGRDESNRRQAWLDEEVVKAEAQIDLIKDVLLRQKAD